MISFQVITPDTWKAGARNTTEGGGRKVGENKLLTAKKNRFNPATVSTAFILVMFSKRKSLEENLPL